MTGVAVKGGCCFCGSKSGKPYPISPHGYACPVCTDAFFTWAKNRNKRYWSAFTEADLRDALVRGLGPPFKGRAVSDLDRTGKGSRMYGRIDVVRGLYAFAATVYWKTRTVQFGLREWDQITSEGAIRFLVGRVRDRVTKEPSGYVVGTADLFFRGTRIDGEAGPRIGIPFDLFTYYDLSFGLKEGATV